MNASALPNGLKDLSPELLASRVLPRLPLIISSLLAIALGVQLAAIVLDLLPQQQAPASVSPVPVSQSQAPRSAPVDAAAIQNAHLFGIATAGPASGDPANAPQTQLNLVLAGTFATDDPETGVAIIGETAANAKVYKVGKPVPGGARLHAVYTDRVVLDRNGQLETLLLPRLMSGGRASPSQGGGQTAGAALASRVRQMISQDPGSITEIMRPQAVFSNGQQRGYRVYPGRNRAQFSQLGLQPGDLVVSINGSPLDDPARGMEIFKTMGASDQVRVTIERRGQQQELMLNMGQLNQAAGQPIGQPMDQGQQMPPNPEPQ